MTPEVIVHHPIPHDLETVLRSLGYSATGTSEAHTQFVWKPDTVSVSASASASASASVVPRNPLEVRK